MSTWEFHFKKLLILEASVPTMKKKESYVLSAEKRITNIINTRLTWIWCLLISNYIHFVSRRKLSWNLCQKGERKLEDKCWREENLRYQDRISLSDSIELLLCVCVCRHWSTQLNFQALSSPLSLHDKWSETRIIYKQTYVSLIKFRVFGQWVCKYEKESFYRTQQQQQQQRGLKRMANICRMV